MTSMESGVTVQRALIVSLEPHIRLPVPQEHSVPSQHSVICLNAHLALKGFTARLQG
jgi:hypothetical protein